MCQARAESDLGCGGWGCKKAEQTGQASFSQVCQAGAAFLGAQGKAASQAATTQEKAGPREEGFPADRMELVGGDQLGDHLFCPKTPPPTDARQALAAWRLVGRGGGKPGTAGGICFQHSHHRDRDRALWAQLPAGEKASAQFQLSWRSRTAEAGSPAWGMLFACQ